MNNKNEINSLANSYSYLLEHSKSSTTASEKLKNSLKIFDGIRSIEEAKKIAKEQFKAENEFNYINCDNAACVFIVSSEHFKVCFEDENEVIYYNITKDKAIRRS